MWAILPFPEVSGGGREMVRRVPGVAWLDLAAEAEQREQAGLRTARWLRLKTEGPRRPRVGATGHLGDEGCRSHPRARVLVTGTRGRGCRAGVRSQEAQACACTPVWACALPGPPPADVGWRGRYILKVRVAVPAPRVLTAL